jgi:hypothetical protein
MDRHCLEHFSKIYGTKELTHLRPRQKDNARICNTKQRRAFIMRREIVYFTWPASFEDERLDSYKICEVWTFCTMKCRIPTHLLELHAI